MDRDAARPRNRATVTVLAGLLALAPLLCACGSGSSGSSQGSPAAVVERAEQVWDDAGYLPVQSGGHWTLASPGSWLQPTISLTSSPWRWTAGRCTVFDASLVPGMEAFMHAQIAATFAGAEAARVTATFDARLPRLGTTGACVRPPGGLTLGPPGPIRDRTTVTHLSLSGATGAAAGVVHMTDWQGGVTGVTTAGGGRRVSWAVVSNVVDATYKLARLSDGRWRVVALTGRFAPGSEP
ncbi:MAG: hypothetical protein ABSE98_00730 [Acidimicrobiales bacterium]